MGNNNSNSYSIEKFIGELNIRELHNVPNTEIKDKLANILDLFQKHNNYYINLKKQEDSTFLGTANLQNEKITEENEFESPDKENSGEDEERRKTYQFCNIITFMMKLNFQSEFHYLYLMLLDIYAFLSKYSY
jgi:hypothetical protein